MTKMVDIKIKNALHNTVDILIPYLCFSDQFASKPLLQLHQIGAPTGIPRTKFCFFGIAIPLLIGQLVAGQRVSYARQQRKQVDRPAVLHWCARGQDCAHAGVMAAQAESRLAGGGMALEGNEWNG